MTEVRARSYADRAARYAVELAALTPPTLLDAALRNAGHLGCGVLEVPSGTGHYVGRYAAAGAAVTLMDAEPEMLRHAALAASDGPAGVITQRGAIPDVIGGSQFGLAVVPNAAMNMLAVDASLTEVFACLARQLVGGGRLLAELLPEDSDDGPPFAIPCADWTLDWRRPLARGGSLARWRRAERHRDLVRVHYRYDDSGEGACTFSPATLPQASVTFQRLELADVITMASAAGLRFVELVQAHEAGRGLDEALFVREPLAPGVDATVADATGYAARYYADEFWTGQGTEDVLAALRSLPPVGWWLDAGCGSESLFWATNLQAAHLVAVDIDPDRLAQLRSVAASTTPPGAYCAALQLGGRDEAAWPAVTASLTSVRTADVLAPAPDPPAMAFDLVTQFGLLGLCRDEAAFTAGFACLASHARPGGWIAGANWHAARPDVRARRVQLDEQLYWRAAAAAQVELSALRTIPVADDPDFTAVTYYTGRKAGQP